jgi:sulfur-oxidizing protein SoxY
MNRRNFLGLGLGVAAAAAIPTTLSAVDFRATKSAAWIAMNDEKAKGTSLSGTKAAMKELFGTDATTEAKVKIKAPDIAENGAVVPVTVSSKLAGKTVAIFQSANPESLVCVFTVPAKGVVDYSVRIKMMQTGTVTAVVEADGKLYSAAKSVKVTAGGCGG